MQCIFAFLSDFPLMFFWPICTYSNTVSAKWIHRYLNLVQSSIASYHWIFSIVTNESVLSNVLRCLTGCLNAFNKAGITWSMSISKFCLTAYQKNQLNTFLFINSCCSSTSQKEQLFCIEPNHRIEKYQILLQILSGDFLKSYGRDIINIHHGLLPSFKGGNPSKQVNVFIFSLGYFCYVCGRLRYMLNNIYRPLMLELNWLVQQLTLSLKNLMKVPSLSKW